jgi:hypothetical protein
MKTLDVVEPRTPIEASDLPLSLTTSGSYYLIEDITTAGDGITISADDVTIDLMGFTLAGGTGDGISSVFPTKNVTVRNGTVSGWGGSGIDVNQSDGSRVERVRADSNESRGIRVGENAAVIDCIATGNTASGIQTEAGATVSGCSARGNTGTGVAVSFDSAVLNTTSSENGLGFNAAASSFVNCVANNNNGKGFQVSLSSTVVGSTASSNDDDGITISGGGVVQHTSVTLNDGDGIEAGDHTLILGNTIYRNGPNVGGRGVYLFARGNRIEGNNINFNDVGIKADQGSNLIIKNSFHNNQVTDLDLAPGNDVGPLGTAATSTSPWANIQVP